jgi:hypothetical protein
MRTKLPFVGPSYQARSLNADAQRTLNCYVELDNTSPRAPLALYGTPGLARRLTFPTAPVRFAIKEGAYSWWVAGNTVYRVDSAYQKTVVGTISSYTGPVDIASNGGQLLIVDGVHGWIVDVKASTLAAITDGGFPSGVTRAAYQDGWFLVTGDGTGKFYMNETPNDGKQWNGLDFASAEGSPDNTIGIVSDHRELWLFGGLSAEVWVNTGSADMPFQRSGNVFIEHGCAAAGTVAKADNTVFWLGADDKGAGIVWRADGYTPLRISTHAVERAIGSYSTISDAYAFTYQQEGHIFYVLTFPTAGATWCYDAATQLWHERAWRDPDTGQMTRWRPSCHVYANGEHLVGDFETGAVYALDLDAYSDDGAPILRLRRTAASENFQQRMFYSRLQIDMETGVGIADGQGSAPLLMLRYSSDGGHTWNPERTATVGAAGQYGARAAFNRLGSGRNRVWEISMTDPVKFAVFGAVLDVEPGAA